MKNNKKMYFKVENIEQKHAIEGLAYHISVPFWVQNSVICFAENWRQYKEVYMDQWLLKNRNIDINIY